MITSTNKHLYICCVFSPLGFRLKEQSYFDPRTTIRKTVLDSNLNHKHNTKSMAFDLYSKRKHPKLKHRRPNLTVEAVLFRRWKIFSLFVNIRNSSQSNDEIIAFDTINHCTIWHETFVYVLAHWNFRKYISQYLQ